MARHTIKTREEARRLFLTNEVTSVAEIARRLKVKPHTIGMWRKEEDWDAMRLKIDKRAAEKLVEELANERVALNAQHYKFWNMVMSRTLEAAQKGGMKAEEIRTLEKMANIIDKAQKGQRLAPGLSLDGQTEEQVLAESAAAQRHIVDVVIDVVKTEVKDELLRDRIARVLLERFPAEDEDDPEAA